MEFTFGVLTFCQEKIVCETLESIKYQLNNYGKDIAVNLYIIDDCSSDDTAQVCERWVANNISLFKNTKIIKNDVNQGTVANYLKVIDLVKDEYFKVIAGDDLFSSENLFIKYTGLDDNTLRVFTPLYLTDGKVYKSNARVLNTSYFKNKKINKRYALRQMMKGAFFNTPSVLYTKGLFEKSDSRSLLSSFRLFEDDPTWFSMVKNVEGLKIEFSSDVVVLYRFHNASVSHIKNKVKSRFQIDKENLHKIYTETSSIFMKIYLAVQDSDCYWLFRLDRYWDHCVNLVRKLFVYVAGDYKKCLEESDRKAIEQQKFYDTLLEQIR